GEAAIAGAAVRGEERVHHAVVARLIPHAFVVAAGAVERGSDHGADLVLALAPVAVAVGGREVAAFVDVFFEARLRIAIAVGIRVRGRGIAGVAEVVERAPREPRIAGDADGPRVGEALFEDADHAQAALLGAARVGAPHGEVLRDPA